MKKRLIKHGIAIMGIAALAFLAIASTASITPAAAGAYNRGINAYNAKNYDQAIAEYTKAIQLYPDFKDAYINRGVAYSSKGDYDRAIADYETALRLDPNDDYARKNLEIARQKKEPNQSYEPTRPLTEDDFEIKKEPNQSHVPTRPLSEDDFEVKQNADNTITITGYKGEEKNLVIPDTLYGLKVTIIGGRAFRNKDLTSIVIPDTVTSIEHGNYYNDVDGIRHYNGAFSDNPALAKLTLGKGLKTIGNYAFSKTGLTEVIIPDSVTAIGERAFGANKLVKVTFGTRLQAIGNDAFYGNQIEELNLPSSLRELGGGAFYNNKIQKITFGTGLENIGRGVFASNKIAELNLPSSLKTIGGGAFADNKIQSLTIPNGVTSMSSSSDFSNNNNGAFRNNPLTTVVIPPSLANGRIDSVVFGNTNGSAITRITIPAGMDENTLKGIFETSFVNFWINQNRAGGTYVKNGPIWSKE